MRRRSLGLQLGATLAATMLLSLLAAAQEHNHPPQDAELHDKFYSTWMIPPGRNMSCCNKHDCYPTPVRKAGKNWVYLDRELSEWAPIPNEKLEHGQTDPRDSPDGQSHVCAKRGYVYCAVLGGGQ
jgi:hypothetical protein